MRRILTEFYSLLYRLTGIKLLSYATGLVYVTILNYIVIKGLAVLMQGLFGIVSIVLSLFAFPVYFVTILLIFGLTFWLTPTVQSIAKDAKKNRSYSTLLLYTLFGIVLFTYTTFGHLLFT
jgi:hypothetical protein